MATLEGCRPRVVSSRGVASVAVAMAAQPAGAGPVATAAASVVGHAVAMEGVPGCRVVAGVCPRVGGAAGAPPMEPSAAAAAGSALQTVEVCVCVCVCV